MSFIYQGGWAPTEYSAHGVIQYHCPKTQKAPPWAGLHYQVASTWHPGSLGEDVDCARTFLALLDVEGDGLSLGQRFEAACLDGAMMDEDVL